MVDGDGLTAQLSFKSCPREGASLRFVDPDPLDSVSSHAPVRGHLKTAQITAKEMGFKSCPRGGASRFHSILVELVCRFKSCPREGASGYHR